MSPDGTTITCAYGHRSAITMGSAPTGLDGGMPSATDLIAVNTFDPDGGPGPQESNPAPSALAALLPNQQKTPSAGSLTHIGEGLPPVPARLAAKILRHEFVEMHKLLPEFWQDHKEGGKAGDRAKAKGRALNLKVWLQCYAAYVGVLGPKYPHEVPELMAYMISIIRASQEDEGLAWAAYDAAYRWQTAAQGKTEWSRVNPSLYAICFTGKARRADRCDRCLSTTHKAEDCSLFSEDDPDVSQRLKTIESVVVTLTRAAPAGPTKPCGRSTETCRNWNQN